MAEDAVPVGYLLAGTALLLAAVLPRVLRRTSLTPAMVFLTAGAAAGAIPGAPALHPLDHPGVVEHLTELCVIVALMGVGLALDRPLSLRGWGSTWRLLGIAMPLFIGVVAIAAWGLLGLAPATALLLGAVLAPTDPVLASDVEVGEPTDDPGSEDDLRFALTSEAGLNDALAFRAPVRALRFADTAEAVVALAAVFLAYGVTELVGGYGFLAVFAAGLALRAQERGHEFHRVLHEFITLVERLLTMALLLAFGYSLGSGLLADLTWGSALLAIGAVVVARPLVGAIAMRGAPISRLDRRSIAFFGVKGIGSFYYAAFALGAASFPGSRDAWAIVAFAVLVSVVVHGSSAWPILHRIDQRLGRPTPEPVA